MCIPRFAAVCLLAAFACVGTLSVYSEGASASATFTAARPLETKAEIVANIGGYTFATGSERYFYSLDGVLKGYALNAPILVIGEWSVSTKSGSAKLCTSKGRAHYAKNGSTLSEVVSDVCYQISDLGDGRITVSDGKSVQVFTRVKKGFSDEARFEKLRRALGV